MKKGKFIILALFSIILTSSSIISKNENLFATLSTYNEQLINLTTLEPHILLQTFEKLNQEDPNFIFFIETLWKNGIQNSTEPLEKIYGSLQTELDSNAIHKIISCIQKNILSIYKKIPSYFDSILERPKQSLQITNSRGFLHILLSLINNPTALKISSILVLVAFIVWLIRAAETEHIELSREDFMERANILERRLETIATQIREKNNQTLDLIEQDRKILKETENIAKKETKKNKKSLDKFEPLLTKNLRETKKMNKRLEQLLKEESPSFFNKILHRNIKFNEDYPEESSSSKHHGVTQPQRSFSSDET